MSKYLVYIENIPPYLDQWLRHEFWSEEYGCVVFPKASTPHTVMKCMIRARPAGLLDHRTPQSLPIGVPAIRGLNPAKYNYLPESGRRALVKTCKQCFITMLHSELSPLYCTPAPVTDIIYDFLDRHGIEPTERNWDTVRQMYVRLRKRNKADI